MAEILDDDRMAAEAPENWTILPPRLTAEQVAQFQRLRHARRIEFDPCVPCFSPDIIVQFQWRASRQELALRRNNAIHQGLNALR